MLRADELMVVHHDDTVSQFTNVTYTIGRDGLRLVTAGGDEKAFPQHDILTTIATTRPVLPTQRGSGCAGERRFPMSPADGRIP